MLTVLGLICGQVVQSVVCVHNDESRKTKSTEHLEEQAPDVGSQIFWSTAARHRSGASLKIITLKHLVVIGMTKRGLLNPTHRNLDLRGMTCMRLNITCAKRATDLRLGRLGAGRPNVAYVLKRLSILGSSKKSRVFV